MHVNKPCSCIKHIHVNGVSVKNTDDKETVEMLSGPKPSSFTSLMKTAS